MFMTLADDAYAFGCGISMLILLLLLLLSLQICLDFACCIVASTIQFRLHVYSLQNLQSEFRVNKTAYTQFFLAPSLAI